MTTYQTTSDIAIRLGVNRRTIQRWVREKRIPHQRLGTQTIRFTEDQVRTIDEMHAVGVVEHRPEADTPNPRFRPYITNVAARRPGDAA